jgi:uncharacterized protein (TIGR00730 family)
MRKRICVFCGSNPGSGSAYLEAARSLGRTIAESGRSLVYGGAKVGMMGVLADATLAGGGEVIGVMPEGLIRREIAHTGLTALHTVDSMHQRKALMAELADGFIAMPGGYGTLDEFCEILTWSQLGLHEKPCGMLNIAGYFDSLLAFLDHAVQEQLLRPAHRNLILTEADPLRLLCLMEYWEPVHLPKWITRSET